MPDTINLEPYQGIPIQFVTTKTIYSDGSYQRISNQFDVNSLEAQNLISDAHAAIDALSLSERQDFIANGGEVRLANHALDVFTPQEILESTNGHSEIGLRGLSTPQDGLTVNVFARAESLDGVQQGHTNVPNTSAAQTTLHEFGHNFDYLVGPK